MKRVIGLSFSLLLLVGCGESANPLAFSESGPTGTAAGAGAFELVELEMLPGFTRSNARAINDQGQIVGYCQTSTGDSRAVIWDVGGNVQEIPPPPGWDWNRAMDINNQGQITGYNYNLMEIPGWLFPEAFLYDPVNGMTPVPSSNPDYPESTGYGINDLGQIAGSIGYSDLVNGNYYSIAAKWTAPDQMIELVPPPGARNSTAYDINNSGDVVVAIGQPSFPSFNSPYLWTSDGSLQELDLLPGCSAYRYAYAINEAGQMVGCCHSGDLGFYDYHAVVWDSPSQIQDIGTLPGDSKSTADCINDLGQVVGSSYNGNSHVWRGFLWTPTGGMVELQGLGGNYDYPSDINNNGWIVGYSRTSTGDPHAVLWKTELELEAEIDIKPGSDENPINLKSKGKIPVAILTTPELNAADIDVSTITLGNDDGDDTPVATQKKGGFMVSLEDIDSDGDLDRVLHFETQMLVVNGDLDSDSTELVLRGTTGDGTPVRGVDRVRIVPQ